MKRTLFLSILIIFIISIVGCNSQQTPTKEKSSISQKELYDLQEKCGKSCKEYNKENKDDMYECHYNKKMNKCFSHTIEVHDNKDRYYLLVDINEHKLYGSCVSKWNEPGTLCDFLGKDVKGKTNWDTLVKPYMEE